MQRYAINFIGKYKNGDFVLELLRQRMEFETNCGKPARNLSKMYLNSPFQVLFVCVEDIFVFNFSQDNWHEAH